MSLLTVHKFYGNTGEHTSQSQNILSTCALNNSPVLIQGCQPRKFLISYTLSLQIHSYQPYVHCKRKYFLFLTFTHHFFDFLFCTEAFSFMNTICWMVVLFPVLPECYSQCPCLHLLDEMCTFTFFFLIFPVASGGPWNP